MILEGDALATLPTLDWGVLALLAAAAALAAWVGWRAAMWNWNRSRKGGGANQ